MGEKDTNTTKQIEMPGFEAPKPSQRTLPKYEQKLLPPLESSELSPKTPRSVSELIDLIKVKEDHSKNRNRQRPVKVKMIDRQYWIDFDNEERGKAAILFIFLSDKQYPGIDSAEDHVKDMEELSEEIYPPDREVEKNILEQVGVYLFSEHSHKAVNRNLDYREIQKGISYCLDPTNRLTVKAMVQENRGYELPEHLLN